MDTSELLKEMESIAGYLLMQSPTEDEALAGWVDLLDIARSASLSGGSPNRDIWTVKRNAWVKGYNGAVRDMRNILRQEKNSKKQGGMNEG